MSRNDSQINKQDQSQPGTHGHTTEFFVDGEPQFTTEHTLTVAQILNLVGLDPATHYLFELPECQRSYGLLGFHPLDHSEKEVERAESVSVEAKAISFAQHYVFIGYIDARQKIVVALVLDCPDPF